MIIRLYVFCVRLLCCRFAHLAWTCTKENIAMVNNSVRRLNYHVGGAFQRQSVGAAGRDELEHRSCHLHLSIVLSPYPHITYYSSNILQKSPLEREICLL